MPQAASCPRHRGAPAVAVCARCGTFVCAEDRTDVDGRTYCSTCAALPEVDYLEAFRLKYWGRRDKWAWIVGLSAPLNLAVGARLLVSENPFGLEAVAAAAVCVCFWLGQKWARVALILLPAFSAAVGGAVAGVAAATGALLPTLVGVAIYLDTRNKLFFKVQVSRGALKKAWHLYANNSIARTGFILGVTGLVALPLAPLALACSIIGLVRVNPASHPPVGRKGQAIAGIVMGAIGTLVGAALLVAIVE